jgi:hypothetical protein
MPDSVNDDLGLGNFLEDQIRVWRRRHAADDRIVGSAANVGILQQQLGDRANAQLNAALLAVHWRQCIRGSR